ncbi:MAG: molybdopterin molybdotransferase MoeA [Hyphomicrobium sp.]
MAMTSVEDALSSVLAGVMPLGREEVGLRFAAGRTLARRVVAGRTHPPFDGSAMDGYAVMAADCAQVPARLAVIGPSAAGRPFAGKVARGQAVRIFTGAAMPEGADAVVIQEDTQTDGATVTVRSAPTLGQNIRPKGQDFLEHDVLIEAGRRLTPRDILLAATGGWASLTVYKRPTVAILATGDELVEPGGDARPAQIYNSNGYALAALVESVGATAKLLGIASDTRESLASALRDGESADILVTIGGASVGDHDLVRPALEATGARLDFHKIAMRPGKPMFSGSRPVAGKTQRILGLPGNPVSAMVTARVFLVPLIARLLDRDAAFHSVRAALAEPLPANGPRTHYMRAVLDETASQPRVSVLPSQDSSLTRALATANALIVMPPDAPAMGAGATVDVLKLDF